MITKLNYLQSIKFQGKIIKKKNNRKMHFYNYLNFFKENIKKL